MNKRELALLEKAFESEIEHAITKRGFAFMQTTSKLAKKLVDDGMLVEVTEVLGGQFPVTLHGYLLTHLGRYTYCATCSGEE